METPEELIPVLGTESLIVGVGNVLRGDDAFGSLLAQRLTDKLTIKVMDTGSAPENYLGKIVKEGPRVVLLIDAVDFGALPGQMRLFDLRICSTRSVFFTHSLAPDFLNSFLQQASGARAYLLAVQPASLGLGDPLSPALSAGLDILENWFLAHYASLLNEAGK
ncbi:MAG: hydrogenase maturation protease [Candidatus Omnitrophica bacterium]|nr:hydrogenase maturation protease [Candidatus Omnitrophota bacterium]